MKARFRAAVLTALAALFSSSSHAAGATLAKSAADVRLYTLDCGRANFKDMGMFADTGEYNDKSGLIVDPCFLIRHPKGYLLWDAGLGDTLAQNKDGTQMGSIRLFVDVTLADQLKTLGLQPGDITYVAFSHFHFDHTGNANLFGASTWIINSRELAYSDSTPVPEGFDPSAISGAKTAKTQMIDGDYDVFGDDSVRILKAPGHTPGHQVLDIALKNSGEVVLSGDLYHMRDNRTFHRVPMNFDRADTLASIDRIETIVKSHKARMVIQHDALDFRHCRNFQSIWIEASAVLREARVCV